MSDHKSNNAAASDELQYQLVDALQTMKRVTLSSGERQAALEVQLSAHQRTTQEALTKLTQSVDRQTENITHLLEQNARYEEKFIQLEQGSFKRMDDLSETLIDTKKRVSDAETRLTKLELVNETNINKHRELKELRHRWVDVTLRIVAPLVTVAIAAAGAIYTIASALGAGGQNG